MCFLRAKPIGLMPMLDQGEQDDKVGTQSITLCVHGLMVTVLHSHASIHTEVFSRRQLPVLVHPDYCC